MNLNDIPLFGMLRGRMGYLTQREQIVSQNVANADTPGFVPKDLKAFTFDNHVKAAGALQPVAPSQTNRAHMVGTAPSQSAGAFKAVSKPDSETTLDGNQVVLEEQMMKMTEARLD